MLTIRRLTILAGAAAALAFTAPATADGPGRFQIDEKNVHVDEGGTVTVHVERSEGDDGAVTVDYSTVALVATEGADYEAAAGTLEWADGDDSTREIVVATLDDDEAEGAEPFRIRIHDATGGATVRNGHDKTQVVIKPSDPDDEGDDDEGDDDEEGDGEVHGVLRFDQADYPADEGSGSGVVTVERAAGTTGRVTVHYAVRKGTATPNRDYRNVAGELVWEDGEGGTKTFMVPLVDDDVEEPTETVFLQIRGATGGAELDESRRDAVLVIADDDDGEGDGGDGSPGVLRFVEGTFQGAEGDGAAVVDVERVQGTAGAVAVTFATADGSATVGGDYLGAGGTLAWDDGEGGVKSFSVDVVDDDATEGNETVNLLLSHPTAGAALDPDQSVATLTVLDDDGDTAACEADADTLCLQDGRFRVEVGYRVGNGASGQARAEALSDSSGVFAFFGASNKEVLLKVLDGCEVPGSDSFWVLYAATTNVGFTVRVTDTATGLTKEYSNPAGKAALPVVDTGSFATCP